MKKRKNTEKQKEVPLMSKRVMAARKLAASPSMTVTLRLPSGFNEWLDSYVALSYPKKFRKGALILEALTLLYLRRGQPKEKVASAISINEVNGEA